MRIPALLLLLICSFHALSLDFSSPPTPQDGAIIYEDHATLQLTISAENLSSSALVWNGINSSFYDDSLVLALNFDNDSIIGENDTHAADISVYGNNGIIYGGNWSTGKYGRALVFNSLTYLVAGPAQSLEVENDSFSVEFWMNIPQSISDKMILSNAQSDYHGYFVAINRGGENIVLGKAGIVDQIANYSFFPNTWYHVALVQHFENSSPSYAEFFVNGIQIGIFEDGRNYTFSSGYEQRIGTGYSVTNNFNGMLDNVRVYKRALSPDEAKQHYFSNFRKFSQSGYLLSVNEQELENGVYSYYAYAGDAEGNMYITGTRTLFVGVPALRLYSPARTTYYNTNYVNLNYSVDSGELETDSCWYSLDSSASITIPDCGNRTLFVEEGQHNFTLYANNSAGGISHASVQFKIEFNRIFSCVNITSPGVYSIMGDLTYSSGSCISILSNNTVLDLNGHSIICTDSCEASIMIHGERSISISNGRLEEGTHGLLYNGIEHAYLRDFSASNLTFIDMQYPIELDYASRPRITGNYFYNTSSMIYGSETWANFTVADNYAENISDGINIFFWAANNTSSVGEINGNIITGLLSGEAIEIAHGGFTRILNNKISGTEGARAGIETYSDAQNKGSYIYEVINNEISNIYQSAIRVGYGTSNSVFERNNVHDSLNGFWIDPESENNSFIGNSAHNSSYGFYVAGDSNSFANNTACDNLEYGFYFLNGSEIAENNHGFGNFGVAYGNAYNPSFHSSQCGGGKTVITLLLRNKELSQVFLHGISLDGHVVLFEQPMAFSPLEKKAISFEVQKRLCTYPGQQLFFDKVSITYSYGLGVSVQTGSLPLVITCS